MTSPQNPKYSPFYFLPNKKFALLWHPKCACTSASAWIASHVEGFDDSKFSSQPRVFLEREGYAFDSVDNLARLCKDGLIKNLVVISRDPLSRMLSSYVSKFLLRSLPRRQVVIPEVKNYEAFAFRFASACSASDVFLHGVKPDMAATSSVDDLDQALVQGRRHGEPSAHRGDLRGLSLAYFLLFINHTTTNAWGLDPHFRPQIVGKHQFQILNQIRRVAESFSILRVESLDDDIAQLSATLELNALKLVGNKTRYPDGWHQSDSTDTVLMPTEELAKNQLVPSKKALVDYLASEPGVDVMSAFKYDYMLFGYAMPK